MKYKAPEDLSLAVARLESRVEHLEYRVNEYVRKQVAISTITLVVQTLILCTQIAMIIGLVKRLLVR